MTLASCGDPEGAIMTGPSGTHLCLEDLDNNIREEVEDFGKWVAEKGNFKPLTDEIHTCGDKNAGKKFEPILKALGYKVRNFHLVLTRGLLVLKTVLIPSSMLIFKSIAW